MAVSHAPVAASSQRVLRAAATCACWLLVLAGATTFGFFWAVTPTRWYIVRATELIAFKSTLVLDYKFANATTGKATPLLSGTVSFMLIWQWCATLAAALGAAGLLWLAPDDRRSTRGDKKRPSLIAAMNKAATRARRLLSWQVPPRNLWRTLLGGLSFLDLLLILLWLGLHVLWMRETTMRVLDNRRANPPPPKASAARSPPPVAQSNAAMPPSAVKAISMPTPAVRRALLAAAPTTSANKTTAPPPPAAKQLTPLPRVVQNNLAKYYGWVGRLDMLVLFFPLPRCNFLHWLLGADFAALIKYHRWLGHGTLVMMSLHGIMYMGIWARDGILVSMLNWGMDAGVNRLSGLVALCGGWLLWVTSIPVVRRRLFNFFLTAHLTGALIFMLFAFMHRKDIATWVMPGVLLYLLDVAMRTVQQAFNSTTVTATPDEGPAAATISRDGHVLTFSLKCNESMTWVGSDTIFLNAPAISWWQWHPFTLASSSTSCPSSGGGKRMVLHIKQYNRWTKRLISRLATDATPVKLYVSGPYSGANRSFLRAYDRHIFIAGGIGVTPALGMIHELIDQHRMAAEDGTNASEAGGPPGRVSLVWVSRSLDELSALPPAILLEASRNSWLDLQLYLTTGGEQCNDAQAPAQLDAAAAAEDASPAIAPGCFAGLTARLRPDLALRVGCPMPATRKGPAATPAAPLLAHPYMFSPLLWAAAVVLCFVGAFAGFLCSQAYDAHKARTVKTRRDFAYVGLLQFAGLAIGTLLPPTVLMLVAHTWRALSMRRKRAASGGSSQQPTLALAAGVAPCNETEPAACSASITMHASTAAMASPPRISAEDSTSFTSSDAFSKAATAFAHSSSTPLGIDAFLVHGRPDLNAMLRALSLGAPTASAAACGGVAVQGSGGGGELEDLRVGLFVAGPPALVAAVREAGARVNGVWGRAQRAYLDMTTMTHEL
ncbi:Ferric reduction oxidase 2 [Tetrabaena socialis]|uniref:Ferric reduction oxidase 2 n=1 Tax=Tetrabaena socialis TaxID=47790 RepID=A0A2J8AKC4_9CHLO|nr:Ferric reduction oxidase 2 [Tetrabaena socialis]|eukprot:PNH12965.1 Ferric reduction oxidase 2 [Tetrabaena socialis]